MNLTTLIISIKKAWIVANDLFTVCSLFAVPVLLTVPLVWVLEGDGGSVQSTKVMAKARVGEKYSLSPDLRFTQTPMRVRYHLELVDETGRVAFVYPETVAHGTPQLDNMLFSVPSFIRPGDYRLIARISYAMNPVVGSERVVQIASVSVD